MLQLAPEYSEEQLHLKLPESLLQVPPFWQGLGEHGSPDGKVVKISHYVNTINPEQVCKALNNLSCQVRSEVDLLTSRAHRTREEGTQSAERKSERRARELDLFPLQENASNDVILARDFWRVSGVKITFRNSQVMAFGCKSRS